MATRPSGSTRIRPRAYARSAAVALIVAAASENGMSAPMPGVPIEQVHAEVDDQQRRHEAAGEGDGVPQCAPLDGVNAPLHLGRCERQRVGGVGQDGDSTLACSGGGVAELNPSMVLMLPERR